MTDEALIKHLARIVANGVAAGLEVEIEPLGVFFPDALNGLRFEPRRSKRLFVAYVKEDREAAERLCDSLESAGFTTWIDVRRLLPGQNWPRAIESAIESSDFFVACFSHNSATKRGGFQAEIRYALDCARRLPLEDIFIVPVRLDPCRVPRSIQREYQYVDLFPDWDAGVRRVTSMVQREAARRRPL